MFLSSFPTLTLIWAFVLLWNSGFISAEYGLPYAEPFTLLFWRYWILSGLLLVYLLSRNRLQWPGFPSVNTAIGTGILAHGIWLSCVLVPLQQGVPAGIVALIVALQPLATGMFSGLALGESPQAQQWLGLIVGLAGVALAVGPRLDLSEAGSWVGYLLPLVSVASITVSSLIQRGIFTRHPHRQLPIDVTLFYQSLGTAVFVSIPAIALEGVSTQWDPTFLRTLAWLILAVSLSAYGLMWILLTRIDATQVASLFYLGPPVTMLMAWIAFGEVPLLMDYLGLVVVVVGVILVQKQAWVRPQQEKKTPSAQ